MNTLVTTFLNKINRNRSVVTIDSQKDKNIVSGEMSPEVYLMVTSPAAYL